MRAQVRVRTGKLAVTAGLAMVLGAGLASTAQASQVTASEQAVGRTHPATTTVEPQATKLLFNQNSDWSGSTYSQNSGNGASAQAADDFTVPQGQTWTITQVDVNGSFQGESTSSFTVFFYKNEVNKKVGGYIPGAVVKSETRQSKDYAGLYVISGITGVTLPTGHYWVSVEVNQIYSKGQWFWDSRSAQNGSPAVWENPSGGWGVGCKTWYNMQTCISTTGQPDLMFGLYGGKS